MLRPLPAIVARISRFARRNKRAIRWSRQFRPAAVTLEARVALAQESNPGYEIAYIGDLGADYTGPTMVYVADGSNPINAEEWATYTPPPGYVTNSTRNVQFNSSTVITSPDSTTGKTYITTSDGYTWLFIAQTVSANWPFDPADYPDQSYTTGYEAAALNPTPPPGVIRWSDNTKNQEITWYARTADDGKPIERYFITDRWGDRFIMQASGEPIPRTCEAIFFRPFYPKAGRNRSATCREISQPCPPTTHREYLAFLCLPRQRRRLVSADLVEQTRLGHFSAYPRHGYLGRDQRQRDPGQPGLRQCDLCRRRTRHDLREWPHQHDLRRRPDRHRRLPRSQLCVHDHAGDL